nr:HNH endonuclease [Anaerolineae bacterium]
MKPVPKPEPSSRGHGSQRNRSIVDAARERDGVCLVGLWSQDGCVPGVDVAHIRGWGAHRSSADVLENVICLCRKHHQLHENGAIPDITLQGILYHYYGYGPEPDVVQALDWIREFAQSYGLQATFRLTDALITVRYAGLFSNLTQDISWPVLERRTMLTTTVDDFLYSKTRK